MQELYKLDNKVFAFYLIIVEIFSNQSIGGAYKEYF